ncbi:hypothetical protein V2J09_015596 [Rumex salicifolius]
MDSPPDLSLSPPTPSPIFHPTTPTSPATPKTAAGNVFHSRRLTTPLQNPKKKRTKVLCFQLQHGGEASSSSFAAVVKPKPAARKPDPSAPKITMPCSECGKKFWSWKALYGHMRCHPDRQWRGIHPPPNHLLRLPEPSPVPDITTLTPEDHEAASCLLLLANSPVVDRPCDELAIVVASASNHLVVVDDGETSSAAMEAGHRCGICWKVFSSGQALGGHKRCHWEKNASSGAGREDPMPEFSIAGGLDLNLPAEPVEQTNDVQLRLGI